MFDALRRLAMIGIGAISTGESEVREAIAELRKKQALSEEEGQRILTDWSERVARNRREVQELVEETLQNALRTLDIPSREEFDALASRVAALESKSPQERT